jgi:hypothetical protein
MPRLLPTLDGGTLLYFNLGAVEGEPNRRFQMIKFEPLTSKIEFSNFTVVKDMTINNIIETPNSEYVAVAQNVDKESFIIGFNNQCEKLWIKDIGYDILHPAITLNKDNDFIVYNNNVDIMPIMMGESEELNSTIKVLKVENDRKNLEGKSIIDFDSVGGEIVPYIIQDEGSNVSFYSTPTKPGYSFAGWEPDSPQTMPTENLLVKAKWENNEGFMVENVNTYGGLFEDFLTESIKTSDGGYFIAGNSKSNEFDVESNYPTGQTDFFMAKLDEDKNIVWSKTYGYKYTDYLTAALETNDGGFLVTGLVSGHASNDTGPYITDDFVGDGNIAVVKLDSNGNILWDRIIGIDGYNDSGDVIKMGNDFIVSGYVEESILGDDHTEKEDIYLARISSSGQILWTQILGGSENDKNPLLVKHSETEFTVVALSHSGDGDVPSLNGSPAGIWIMNMDLDGNIVSNDIIETDKSIFLEKIIKTSDGKLMAIEGHDLFCFNSDNSLSYKKEFPEIELTDITEHGNSKYVVTGYEYFYGGSTGIVLNLDRFGNKLWETEIPAPEITVGVHAVNDSKFNLFSCSDQTERNTIRGDMDIVSYDLVLNDASVNSKSFLIFNTDGGNEIEPIKLEIGEEIGPVETPVKDGFTFDGWNPEIPETMPSESLTVTAQWKTSTTFQIEHYKRGFFDEDYSIAETEIIAGLTNEEVSAVAKEYDNFHENETHPDRVSNGTVQEDGSLTLKLYYDEDPHLVIVKDYDNTVLTSFELVNMMDAPKVDPTMFVRDGYVFVEVVPQFDPSENPLPYELPMIAVYEEAELVDYTVQHFKRGFIDPDYTLAETETLQDISGSEVIAVAKKYSSFHENETHPDRIASGIVQEDGSLTLRLFYDEDPHLFVVKDYDNTVVLSQEVAHFMQLPQPDSLSHLFTREGYTFDDILPQFDPMAPSLPYELPVVATYTANEDTAYKAEHYQKQLDGSYILVDTDNLTGTTDTSATASAKTYTGFSENATHSDRVASGTIAGDESLVLELYYDRDTYTVDFKDHDGTVIDSQSIQFEDSATAPTDPTREGYTFTGWDKNFDNITSNLVVNALYEVGESTQTYTVEFRDYDDSVIDTQEVEEGQNAAAPADPTREGYIFAGWDVDFTGITGDLTVTATYAMDTIVTYTVEENILRVEVQSDETNPIRTIELLRDNTPVTRAYYTNVLEQDVSVNGEYKIVVTDSNYNKIEEVFTVDAGEDLASVFEINYTIEEDVLNVQMNTSEDVKVRTIELYKNGSKEKTSYYKDFLIANVYDVGNYKIVATNANHETVEETFTVEREGEEIPDNTFVINHTIESGLMDISVDIPEGKSLRRIELYHGSDRIDSAYYRSSLSKRISEIGEYKVVAISRDYEITEKIINVTQDDLDNTVEAFQINYSLESGVVDVQVDCPSDTRVRTIEIYRDGTRLSKTYYRDHYSKGVPKNGTYKIIASNSRYETIEETFVIDDGEDVVLNVFEIQYTLEETDLDVQLNISADVTVRTLELYKDDSLVSRKYYNDKLSVTELEAGNYTIKATNKSWETIEQAFTIE